MSMGRGKEIEGKDKWAYSPSLDKFHVHVHVHADVSMHRNVYVDVWLSCLF